MEGSVQALLRRGATLSALERISAIFTRRAESPLLLRDQRTWTYAEVAAQGSSRAEHWRAGGLMPRARVLLKTGDRLEFLFGFVAAVVGGYDLALVSEKATAAEVDYIRSVARCDLEWSGAADALNQAEGLPAPRFHNINIVFFTSGTTSRPKGVCQDLETLLANADAFNERAEIDERVRMFHVMPTGYMAGLLNTFLSPIMAGGSVALGELFDVRSAMTFWNTAQQLDVNALWLSPTMAATLTSLVRGDTVPAWTRSHLRHVFVGTAPLHQATRYAFFDRFGVDCLESYGMTECMFVSVNPPSKPNPGGSVGILLRGVQAQIRTAEGLPVAHESEGQLWLKSAYGLRAYLTDDGRMEPVSTEWLDTGDLGRFDTEGRLTITGRRKDLIIHGGTNVSPKAVEDVLLSFPGVQDAAVIGVPHTYWGEEVLAYLIESPGLPIDIKALRAHCAVQLNADAVPANYLVVGEFPRSSGGKIQKHLLRQDAVNALQGPRS